MPTAHRKLRIRFALPTDLEGLRDVRRATIPGQQQAGLDGDQLAMLARGADQALLQRSAAEGCVLIGEAEKRPVALAALDLDEGALSELHVLPAFQGRGYGRRMLATVERVAATFQLLRLSVHVLDPSAAFFRACGYRDQGNGAAQPEPLSGLPGQRLVRSFPGRQTRLGREVEALGKTLGIPHGYARTHRLPLQRPPGSLIRIGPDIYERPQFLAPGAAKAFARLRSAAASDGVDLQVVSAYRSIRYQAAIVWRKLEREQTISDILRVSAAPGFSEHHTGRAVDLTTPGAPVLEEDFSETSAYEWLCANAGDHGFVQSFPRDNLHGIAFEPWHWCHLRRRRPGR